MSLSTDIIDKAVEALKKNEFIIYPTDTLYGIGIDLSKEENYKKLIELKKRDNNFYFLAMFASVKQLKEYIDISRDEEKIILDNENRKFSFLIRKKLKKPVYTGPDHENALRFRISNFLDVQRIISKLGNPISSTSVNFAGQKPAFSAEEIPLDIKNKVSVIVDIGKLEGQSSTLIDITEKKILRQGQNDPVW